MPAFSGLDAPSSHVVTLRHPSQASSPTVLLVVKKWFSNPFSQVKDGANRRDTRFITILRSCTVEPVTCLLAMQHLHT